MRRLFAAGVLSFALAGCSAPPTGGVVVDMERQPEIFIMYSVTIMCGNGCVMIIPQFIYDDEDWVLVIEDERFRQHRIYVSEERFNATRVGEFIGGLERADFQDNGNHEVTEAEYNDAA